MTERLTMLVLHLMGIGFAGMIFCIPIRDAVKYYQRRKFAEVGVCVSFMMVGAALALLELLDIAAPLRF